MLLAIDAGNTNIVFAVFDGTQQKGQWRIATDSRRTSDEYAVWLVSLMAMRGLRPIDVTRSILSSVVPAATFNLAKLCRDHFGTDPMRVGDPGRQARYPQPAAEPARGRGRCAWSTRCRPAPPTSRR